MLRLTIHTNTNGQFNPTMPGPLEKGNESVPCRMLDFPEVIVLGVYGKFVYLILIDKDGANIFFIIFIRLILISFYHF